MIKEVCVVCILFYVFVIVHCKGEEELSGDGPVNVETVQTTETAEEVEKLQAKEAKKFDMERAIQNIESLAGIAEQMSRTESIAASDIEKFYDYMVDAIDKLNEEVRESDNVYKFFKTNGVLRVLSNNLMNPHPKLRTKLLILLKDIFYITPTTAETFLPLNIVDRLIEIFERDDNLALKAHALDILYKWLPNNPKIQIRFMKVTSLQSFYKQVEKLDVGVIQTLMELFNTILKEHVKVKTDKAMISKDDGETLKMYQTIGLLQYLSTPEVCNGLLNIFELLWSYNKNESDHIKTVLELIKNVKPFCSKHYKKKKMAVKLFKALLKHVKNEEKKEYLEKQGLNIDEIVKVIEGYLNKYEDHEPLVPKDEF